MKLYHYCLIFAVIASVVFIRIGIYIKLYENIRKEKNYLQESLISAVDHGMMRFPQVEGIEGLEVNKERVVKDFLASFYASLDIIEPNKKEEFLYYIPLLLVTSMDGYYIYFTKGYLGEGNKTYYKKEWSEKHPFVYEDDDFVYRFTLSDVLTLYDKNGILDPYNKEKVYKLNSKDLIYLDDFADFRNLRPSSFLLKEDAYYQVRKNTIINSMEKSLKEYCYYHNEIMKQLKQTYNFHIPVIEESEWGKTIDHPSLLVLFQGYPLKVGNGLYFNPFIISASQSKKRNGYFVEEIPNINK